MKLKQICLVIFVFIAFCSTSQGQDKSVFNPELLDLGDVNIISSTLIESGDYVIQEFKVEVKQAGKYYLAAWVNGGMDLNGEKLEYSILLNDAKREITIRAKESHPHAVDLGEQMIDLRSGENSIAFKTRKPFCPNVEFIKVSQDERDRQISSEKYDQFIEEISNQKKAATAALSASGLKYTLPNPGGNYDHEMDVNFKYSYCGWMFLEDDEIYTFETSNSNGTDPVIHLLDLHNLHPDYSWTDDNSGSGNNAKLTVDIDSYGGMYYLFIRKAGTSNGTCYLKVSVGTSTYFHTSNCAVSGSRIQCAETVTETLNWFTADLNNSDSHIWLEDQTGTQKSESND